MHTKQQLLQLAKAFYKFQVAWNLNQLFCLWSLQKMFTNCIIKQQLKQNKLGDILGKLEAWTAAT